MKKQLFRKIKKLGASAVLTCLSLFTNDLYAQIVTPTLPQQVIAIPPFCSSFQDDAAVNADMLKTPQSSDPLKAVVWDLGSQGTMGCLGNLYLYIEDYAGNTQTVSLPGAHPDVVLCDDPANPGVDYYAAVAHVDPIYQQVISYFHITNVGTPGLTVTYVGFSVLNPAPQFPLFDNMAYPHIDVLPRPGAGPAGLPLMVNIVAAYEVSGVIIYQMVDVFGTLLLAPVQVGPGTNPDVAAQTDILSGNDYAHILFTDGTRLLHTRAILVPGGSITTTVVESVGAGYYFPRIEAMNIWSPAQNIIQWQGIVSRWGAPATAFEAWGYNPLTGATNLSPLFSSAADVKAVTVAAGAGPTMGNFIGNRQYTIGFFPRQNQNIYARAINATTGAITPQYYRVNNTTVFDAPTYTESDAAKSFALTNCSNNGQFTYSAWFNGDTRIFKKLSPVNSMVFKTTAIEELSDEKAVVYPDPASDRLYIAQSGAYSIYSSSGALLAKGVKETGESPISISALPAGVYLLQLQDQKGTTRNYPFTKQ